MLIVLYDVVVMMNHNDRWTSFWRERLTTHMFAETVKQEIHIITGTHGGNIIITMEQSS